LIVARDALEFESRPGRKSADPLAEAGQGAGFTVRVVRLSSGVVRWAHRHPHSVEVMHVTRGRGVLWEAGAGQRFEQGDTALVAAGVPHATVPDVGTEMELVCFFPHPDLNDNIEELEEMIVNPHREGGR
jgi:quercetin dioxygenase-like cupin family protein